MIRDIFKSVAAIAGKVFGFKNDKGNDCYSPRPGFTALMIINTQDSFSNPKRAWYASNGNDLTAQRIAALLPHFRKMMPVYLVHTGEICAHKEVDFHHIDAKKEDFLVAKEDADASAFAGTDLKNILQEHGRSSLLICGFNLSTDIYRTALDARAAGFNVTILHDLCDNDATHKDMFPGKSYNSMRTYLETRGITVITGQEAVNIYKKSVTASSFKP